MRQDIIDRLNTLTRARLVYDRASGEVLGLFREWREANPDASLSMQGPFGIVELGLELFPKKHHKEAREALGLTDIHNAMLERHQSQEAERYAAARKIAYPRLDAMEAALAAISKEHGCYIGFTMEGDTHGIYESHVDICTEVDGITFTRSIQE